MKWMFMFAVICVVAVVVSDAQRPPTNVFSYVFNSIFRRGTSSRPAGPTSKLTSRNEVVGKTVTVTKTETISEPTSVTETVTETVTERLIATSTLTRKMTATATHIITSCPDVGLRRINWKEIPNRIEEIMKYPVQPLQHTALPDGPYIIGRSIQIESSAEDVQPSE